MRFKNTLFISMSEVAVYVLQTLLGFIVVRLYIDQYGSEINGLVLMAGQVISYVNLVEAGIGSAVVYKLYAPLAENNFLHVNRIFYAAKSSFKKIGSYFLFILLAVSAMMSFFVETDIIDSTMVILVILIIGSRTCLDYFLGASHRLLLIADQKKYKINLLMGGYYVLSSTTSILLIHLNVHVIIVLLGETLLRIMISICILYMTKYGYPWLGKLPKEELDLSFLSMTKDVLIHKIASMVAFNTNYIILSIFSNLTFVSIYGIYNLIIRAITSVLNSFFESTKSSFGNIFALGDKKKLLEIYRQYEFIVIYISTIFSIMLFSMFPSFMTLYVGKEEYINPIYILMFTLVFVFDIIRRPPDILAMASGKFGETKFIPIIEASLNLLISLILVKSLGMVGILIGSITSFIVLDILFIRFTYKHILETKPYHYVKLIVVNMVTGSAISWFIRSLFIDQYIGNWGQWLLAAAILFLVTTVSITFINVLFFVEHRAVIPQLLTKVYITVSKPAVFQQKRTER